MNHQGPQGQGSQAAPEDISLLVSVPRAARLLGIGMTLTWELVHAGAVPSIKLGRRVLIPRAALEQLAHQSMIRQRTAEPDQTG